MAYTCCVITFNYFLILFIILTAPQSTGNGGPPEAYIQAERAPAGAGGGEAGGGRGTRGQAVLRPW